MNITRNWAFARAEHIDTNAVSWIAESRARAGTWVIRGDRDGSIRGMMCPLQDESGLLLYMTPEQRASLGMSDDTYQQLNVSLRLSREHMRDPLTAGTDMQRALAALTRRVEQLERAG